MRRLRVSRIAASFEADPIAAVGATREIGRPISCLRTFLVDEPYDDDDAFNITETFALAQQVAVQALSA